MHYSIQGSGDKIILAFHGFGQDHSAFDLLASKIGEQYTIYSFDLFFHGKSHWMDHKPALTKSFWKKLVTAFCQQEGIEHFTILAFSMGGKFALACIETMPSYIKKLILIAPDGIKTSAWYSLATYPIFFQSYFKSMIVKPGRFYSLLNAFQRFKLLDKGISKFAASQMNTVKKRRRVYYSWITFKLLVFDMQIISRIINNHQIPLDMYIGRYDKIITQAGMEKLLNKLDDYNLYIVESGHNDLIKKISERTDFTKDF
ncbi:MAG: alpha/beta hydrolase, partial [Fulvivirga sp.]|nr:alpha/beta hydrolase [Fulvivirga sp.]